MAAVAAVAVVRLVGVMAVGGAKGVAGNVLLLEVRFELLPLTLTGPLVDIPLPPQFRIPPETDEKFLRMAVCEPWLRGAWYGGGAGVAAGLAVLGGGNGGSADEPVRRYGLPYIALKRLSIPFCNND